MAFIEWIDIAESVEEKAAEQKKAKRKRAEAKPERVEPERVEAKKEEPAGKEEKPAVTPTPAEEPRPKKRRWFGRKSAEDEK
jgi:hypothetical protein